MLYLSDAMPLLPTLPPIKWYTTPLTSTIHQNEGKRGLGREEYGNYDKREGKQEIKYK